MYVFFFLIPAASEQTAHAIPVSSLAREIGLPTWLVDIRHEAAHKQVCSFFFFFCQVTAVVSYTYCFVCFHVQYGLVCDIVSIFFRLCGNIELSVHLNWNFR